MKNIFNRNIKIPLLILIGLIFIFIASFSLYTGAIYDEMDVFNEEGSEERIKIIPKPMSYQSKEGKFILTKDSSIYIKGSNDEDGK